MSREKQLSFVGLLVIVAVWALVLPRLRVDMSMARFVPSGEERKVAELVRSIADSEVSGTTVLDISGAGERDLVDAALALRKGLQSLSVTRDVRSGFDENDQRASFEFLEKYPPTAFQAPESFEPGAVRTRIAELQGALASPLGPLVARLLPRDPLGSVLHLLRLSEQIDGRHLVSKEGILLSEAGDHAFLFFSGRGKAFDGAFQRECFDQIRTTFDRVRGGRSLKLELSGAGPYTVHSENQIRGDIQRISTVSTIGILLLFGVFFRSFRMLLLGLVPLFVGIMIATVGTFLAFREVHGLTLAFGTSLLGVGIDYAEHYFAHFALEPEKGATRIMRAVWPGLWMGALTTVVGLAGIAWADFPCADQMALFSCLAIVGALFATKWLLPPWMPETYARPPLPALLEEAAVRTTTFAKAWLRSRVWPWVIATLALATLATGLLRVRFIDDVSALLATDPAIVREDESVRARLTSSDPGRFAIVVGDDEEQALDALGRASRELDVAVERGLLSHFVPLGSFLRSKRAQAASLEAARTSLPALKTALSENGFRVEAFEPYERALASEATVTTADFFASPMGRTLRPLAPTLAGKRAFLLPLGGVHSIDDLRGAVPSALIVDERMLLEETYRHVRSRVLSLVLLGLVFVFGILYARYRTVRLASLALLPGAASALVTLSFYGWFHVPLNILHIIGFVLVLSMGVDYGIFVVEGRGSPKEAARSLVSVLTATLTTVLSFGLLGWSQNPALRALGLTAALGVATSFLLCPIALLAGPSAGEDEPKVGPP